MNPEHAPLIEMRNIEKHFGSVIALNGVSLEIYPGECHCLLGDNGAGKSTFIKTMSGVHKPTKGEIFLNGKPMAFSSPRDAMEAGIATVFQDLAMIPLMSVTRNFFMGREPTKGKWLFKRMDIDKANAATMEAMREMGIKLRSPDQLAAAKRLFDRSWTASARRTFAAERVEQAFLLAARNTKVAREAAFAKVVPSFGPRGR